MTPVVVALLGCSLGALAASVWFFAKAQALCNRAIAANRETRRMQEEVDAKLSAQLDTLARVEEWSL